MAENDPGVKGVSVPQESPTVRVREVAYLVVAALSGPDLVREIGSLFFRTRNVVNESMSNPFFLEIKKAVYEKRSRCN